MARHIVRKGGSPQGKEEPFLPAYTLQRHRLTSKERARMAAKRAVKGGATSAAASGVGSAAFGLRPKAVLESTGIGAVTGAVLGAATTPKTEYRMRRLHGVTARPTAPGQKPTVYVRSKDEVSKAFESGTDPMGFIQNKADQVGNKARVLRVSALKPKKPKTPTVLPDTFTKSDKSNAAEVGIGTGLGLAAANAGRLEAGLDRTVEASRARLLARAGVNRDGSSTAPKRRDLKGRPLANEGAKARAQKAQRINRDANQLKRLIRVPDHTTIRGVKVPVKPPLLAAGMVGGAGLAWHGSRNLVNKAITRNDVDNAFAGAAGGAGGYQLAMYGTKPIGRRIQAKRNAMSEAMGPSDPNSPNRIMAQHAKKVGLPKDAKLGDPRWLPYFRTMPKQVPGARFDRAMGRLHGGKSGVALTVGTGALAAGGAVVQGRKRQQVSKAVPINHREEVTADLTSNATTNQAMVQRARAWKRQERSGRKPNRTAGPVVRARRLWREKVFTPMERKRILRERADRDLKAVRDVRTKGEIAASRQNMTPAAQQLANFDAGKHKTPDADRPKVSVKLQYNGPGRAPSERLKVA